MPITYIRQKANHNRIRAWGYVGQGGLGEFDPETEEEVVGVAKLPDGYEVVEPLDLSLSIGNLFSILPLDKYTPQQKTVVYIMRGNVEAALSNGDHETAKWWVEQAELTPPDAVFSSVKFEMLSLLT